MTNFWIFKWLPLFVTGAALESAMQIFLKKGALANKETGGLGYYYNVLRNKWVLSGIALYFGEMVIWIIILSYIPLSIAFPITGIQKVFIVLFSFFVLKERLTRVEWCGIGITAMGILVISL